ncbi:PIG-L deacetylase family protein [Aurantiacibacter poecillastricola]|uniref:PIG-L deacetylase family protein n=1 Tax=Aurantiacibacter poecillastricola TaxID=3064385 RepID=UPI00273D1570|nr:PIG-L deacetylase family protein [Aurantiacibacter sp. 219JJ12-13]MDP5259988.1 PIG-L deacetylase family protein [Aurantiacibacter sp. 219JJ12-13]
MTTLAQMGRVLVIAPHPDDEILGCGGTMARLLAAGHEVHVVVATTGRPPAFSAESVAKVQGEMKAAHAFLGVTQTHVIDLPAAALDTVPAATVNAEIGRIVDEVKPDTLFVPFYGDVHGDHQLVFTAALVAARPRHAHAPANILAYETLSETNWYAAPVTPAFVPTVYIDIAQTLETKLDAFRQFESQVRPFPEERSVEAIEALARFRGSTVYCEAAEAFVNVRQILR